MTYFAEDFCGAGECGALKIIIAFGVFFWFVFMAGLLLLPFIFRSESKAKKREMEEIETEAASHASPATAWQYPGAPNQPAINEKTEKNNDKLN